MRGFWKKLFTIGAIAGVGYIGLKGYQRISSVSKMAKTLPDYLGDLLDEKPRVDVNLGLNSLSIAVGLSATVLERIDFDLDEQIKRYIIDFYPFLSKHKISISKYIRTSDEDDFDVDDDYSDIKDAEQCDTYYDKDEEKPIDTEEE